MKAIQITMEEDLLKAFDQAEEVKLHGRSAVFRTIVRDYIEKCRKDSISERYRKAYAGKPGLGKDFAGWEEQGSWPPELTVGCR